MSRSRADALRKVRACLARAKSTNPAEAGIALRQARALMAEHGLSEAEAAGLSEARAKTRSRGGHLPRSVQQLAAVIADGFGCTALQCRLPGSFTAMSFVGSANDVEVATYSFTVMRRMLERDRFAYTKRFRKRTVKATRGEAFAIAWVHAVSEQFPPAEISPERRQALIAAAKDMATHGEAKSRKPQLKRGIDTARDQIAGVLAGRRAILHKGVRGNSPIAISHHAEVQS